jgi:hypothetical protein
MLERCRGEALIQGRGKSGSNTSFCRWTPAWWNCAPSPSTGQSTSKRFQPGTLVVFDRGYSDYNWWLELTRGGVNFVTRLKDSASYGVVESRPVPDGSSAYGPKTGCGPATRLEGSR